MIFTLPEKEKIGKRIIERQELSGLSQAGFAKSHEFNKADISNLRGEKWKENPQLIGDTKWVRFARFVGFTKKTALEWKAAPTKVMREITTQLDACKNYSFTAMLCDEAGIGKTFACKSFAAKYPNVFYIDCSTCRTRLRFIRAIAASLGLDTNGRTDDIFENAIYVLGEIQNPLIILDEVGDLEDRTFLELKWMYNKLEGQCGFYLVGADGLKKKIERGIGLKKVGFTEVYSRFGKKFTRITPEDPGGRKELLVQMVHELLEANGINDNYTKKEITRTIIVDGLKDMRTVRREVIKIRLKKEAKNERAIAN